MQGCCFQATLKRKTRQRQEASSLSDELRRTPESRLTQSPSVRARSTTASLNLVAQSKEMQTHLDSNAGSTLPTSQPPYVKKHEMRAKKFQERCAEENKRALLYTPIDAPDAAMKPKTYQKTSVQETEPTTFEAIQSAFDAIQHMPAPPAWVDTLSFEIGHMKWTMTIHPPGHLHRGKTGQQPAQSSTSSAYASTGRDIPKDVLPRSHSAIGSVDWSARPPDQASPDWSVHPPTLSSAGDEAKTRSSE